jgi:hypothetical protein
MFLLDELYYTLRDPKEMDEISRLKKHVNSLMEQEEV